MTLHFMRPIALLILLMLLLPCLLFCDPDAALSPDVKDILDPVSKKLKAMKDFSADFDYFKEMALLDYTESASGHLKFKRPDMFRMEFTKPAKKTVVSDGTTLFIHLPDLNQVQTVNLNRPNLPGALSSSSGMMRPDEMLSVDVWTRLFSISLPTDIENDIRKSDILELTPLNDDVEVPYEKVLIWIDRKSRLPVRIRTFQSEGEIIATWSFKKVRSDSGVRDSYFEFIPPKDSEVIDF